ncbi:Rrf2 family transcriptional regulator [Pararhodospirillum oryzae]|uniref:SUF system Fe-S cluster assembly regulator n=1 Tax=Pararhodospirillum oryzae TaxID=478448 RepID=A0A512HC94_9PROT|nr:Rrf2 family transcriptional regulator [Pararhodospirillum oryzae]GEO83062.1 SUF system Fe-S cluster assembly regulator [Pararhodospirillum oryzae]
MNLQMATRYALFSLLELAAHPERPACAAEIARKFELSPHHLSKVLRILGREGLVEAARGVGGGYRFVANARRLTLLEIIEIFEPVGTLGASVHPPGDGTVEGQALERVMGEIDTITRATLASLTIETLLRSWVREP